MKQKFRFEKGRIFLFSALLLAMAAVTTTACSNDEESIPIDAEKSPSEFFATNFPQEKDGEGTNIKDVSFAGFDNQENVCLVVNSYEELKSIYWGKESLPEIDFSKNSLIIGRAWGNVGLKFKNLDVAKDGENTIVTLHFTALYDAALTVLTYYYFWALSPKFFPKKLTTKFEIETPKYAYYED